MTKTQDLLPERQLALALVRERQRSDRCGSDVALIRLELPRAADARNPRLVPVLESILGRVRATDDLGWLAPGVLGILLPETGGPGAWSLVRDLLEGDSSGLLQACGIGVLCYPEPLPEGMRPARAAQRVRSQALPVG